VFRRMGVVGANGFEPGRIVEVPQVGGLHHPSRSESPPEWALDSSRNVWIAYPACVSKRGRKNGFVPFAIIFGYRRGFGTV